MPIYDQSTRELLRHFASEELRPGKTFTSREVRDWFRVHWPKISMGTVRATLMALSTNHPSRVHHPVKPGPTHDLFYRIERGQYRLWNPSSDPTPIYPRTTDGTVVPLAKTGPLPPATFDKVTAKHIWQAVQALLVGNVQHSFGPSTDYDVLADDGARLPPKAVFGIAATEALGFLVLPDHFPGGLNTVCFRKIEQAGYEIIRKGNQSQVLIAPPSDEEQEWSEGGKKLLVHLRSERGRGLSAAKKADFISEHGALFCERCKGDPVKEYGEVGEACIEVHHRAVSVSEMKSDHKTKLSDLSCLCANCHRVVHRELRQQAMLKK
ncbi:MAG: hypothetical protein AAB403_05785 [Planctomycetota bacterium]